MRKMGLLLAGLIGLIGLSACVATSSPATPAPTHSPPVTLRAEPSPSAAASAVALPSSTPVKIPSPPFTPVLAPRTPTATPSAFGAALAKTQAAQKYRTALTLNLKQTGAPTYALDVKSDVSNGDSATVVQFGTDKVEVIAARGQFYVRGARNLGLPALTKWYIVTPDVADAAQPPFDAQSVLAAVAVQTSRVAFQPGARESLDGQSCVVWRGAPKTAAETGIGDALGAGQENAFAVFDQAEMKLWLCDDGAAHQISLDVAAHHPKKPAETGAAKLLLRVWDLASPTLKIDPPANAETFRLATPTR